MSFDTEVTADTPLLTWRMDEASGAVAADASGNSHPGAIAGVTYHETGPLNGVTNGGQALGVAGAGSVSGALNLSALNKITLEFWLLWPTTAVDQAILEYTANGVTTAGGFSFSNISGAGHAWRITLAPAIFADFAWIESPFYHYPPTAGIWHHVIIELDRTVGLASGTAAPIKLWVDAVRRPTSFASGMTNPPIGGTFANSTLYALARNAASMFATGKMSRLSVYSGLLSEARIDAHYLAGTNLDWIHSGNRPVDVRDIFPTTPNLWEDDVQALNPPDHANSRIWTNNLAYQIGVDPTNRDTSPYLPVLPGDAGTPGLRGLSTWQGSTPIYVVPDDQPLVRVALAEVVDTPQWSWPRIDNLHHVFMEGIPIPDHAVQDPSFDRSLIIWQPGMNRYWEMWSIYHNPGVEPPGRAGGLERTFEWLAYGGGHMKDTTLSNGTYQNRFDPDGFQREDYLDGHTATSLPMAGGCVTREEWEAELIEHALHLVVGNCWTQFVFPAHRGDGEMDGTWIPEGAWVRIDPALNIDTVLPPTGTWVQRKARMLSKALQKYGALITDKTAVGCTFRFRGYPSYEAEGGGLVVNTAGWLPFESDEQGFFKDYDVMAAIPWGAMKVIDVDWVQTRYLATPPVPEKFENLVDPFDTTISGIIWPNQANQPTVVSGKAHMRLLPAGAGVQFGTYPTFYALTGSEIFFEAVQLPTDIPASEGALKLIWSGDDNCSLTMIYSDGKLICDYHQNNPPLYTSHRVAQPDIDLVNHRWWRIRESAGTVSWEASADGFNYTQLGAVPWSVTGWPAENLTTMKALFFAENYQGNGGAQDFIIDNVNVSPTGTPPPPAPPLSMPTFLSKDWQNFQGGGTRLDADALEDMEARGADYARALMDFTINSGLVLKDSQSPAHYWQLNIVNGVLIQTDLGTVAP